MRSGTQAAIAALINALSITMLGAQQQGIQVSDLGSLRSVGAVRISPDGSRIIYSVQNRDRPGRPYSQTFEVIVASGQTTRFGGESGTASSPHWSPDGRMVAYGGRAGDKSGLIVAQADGSNPVLVAPMEGSNHAIRTPGEEIAWSPDSKRIAFVSATPGPEPPTAEGGPMVITRYRYKSTSVGSTRFDDNKRLHIFVVDLASKQVRQLTDGNYYEHAIDWSPNGEDILFVSNHALPDPDRFFDDELYLLKVADGSVQQLTHSESLKEHAEWSPDGKLIAYEGSKRALVTSRPAPMQDTHIWVMNADGSNPREVGAAIDNRQTTPRWLADGSAIYFMASEHGNNHLYRVPVAGTTPEAVIDEPGSSVGAWDIAKGGTVAYALSTPHDMAELFVKTPGGGRAGASPKRLTALNDTLFAARTIAPVEAFTFLSFDGMPVEAFLTKPPGITTDSRHPMIVMIHGGPHGASNSAFDHKAQVYAAHGWACLMVNYRGSTSYGQKFVDAIFRDQDGGEAKDVLYAVDAAIRRNPWIDPERLGIEGTSYGGQLTNWLITQTTRFKAAIPEAGISNLISFNYMAYYHDYLYGEYGAYPHEANTFELLWDRSALKYVANVRTPTMLVHGENDNDVAIAEAEQFYIALKDVGVETVFLRYPGEGHGLSEVGHQMDLIKRSIVWYDQHFAAARPTT
jgi:dipeptidyl aminopeptidase/acylaminoacyl peptidase